MSTKARMPKGPCKVCQTETSKYKCPVCAIEYCSVPCFKGHKEIGCEKPQTPPQDTDKSVEAIRKDPQTQDPVLHQAESEDIVPQEKLDAVASNPTIAKLLGQSSLKRMLLEIDSAVDREKSLRLAMEDPAFLEFADVVLASTGVSQ
eukprot:TRINITY_DN2754_c0_g1_i2.p1 TRINITY_DN2754_c0_g1~~TRINITY_DN2754_c0_g1_i2.p1  ORF type:complete len:147 (+),score=33.24 TRINITY_DN2754_c0_g1_i2:73-513(+)